MYNPYYNQMMTSQNRLNQMENMFPQFQQQQQQPQIQNVIKGRLVSGIDEVKAAQIDFDGSISYFPDMANGKIYTKQIMLDGNASIKEYRLNAEEEKPKVETDVFGLLDDMQEQIDSIKNEMKTTKGV